jgi:hypothetical protein
LPSAFPGGKADYSALNAEAVALCHELKHTSGTPIIGVDKEVSRRVSANPEPSACDGFGKTSLLVKLKGDSDLMK